MSATIKRALTIAMTGAAAEAIRELMTGQQSLRPTAGFRVRVVPGGCSGFQYNLSIDEEAQPDDHVMMGAPGVRLFIDRFSAQYLHGVEIDYVKSAMGAGFTFKNPNATGGCGCGSSFTA